MKSALFVLTAVVPTLAAQQPTVSPRLERLLVRDTTIAVWLFVQPGRPLADAAGLVTSLGGRVRRHSHWLHAISASLSSAAVQALRTRPELAHLQPVVSFTRRRDFPPPTASMVTGTDPAGYGPSAMPFRRLNLTPLADRGYRGAGVRIAMLDTGFETGAGPFAGRLIIAQRDFIQDDNVVANQAGDPGSQASHGTQTWSLIGANVPDTLVGIAPDAGFILAKTENVASERRVEEDDYVAALEWADSLDADVVSASLGYFDFDDGFTYTRADLNGDVAVTTRAADAAAQRGIIVVVSAGNDGGAGPQSLSTPADGDSVITVGATDSLGNLAGFSSRGPTADGRIKPDLTAPGVAVWVFGPGGYGRSNGTSFSAPIIAGTAALLKQIHPAFGPIQIRDALRGAASNRDLPDPNRGWGTPNATLAAVFPQGIMAVSPNRPVLGEDPVFSWGAPVVAAFAAPLLRYDLRVTRAQGGDLVYSASDLTTMSHAPTQRLRANVSLRWQVRARLGSDSLTSIEGVSFTIVEDAPPVTLLFQNFPNPFPDRSTGQRATCVWFDLSSPGLVRLDVLDLRGHVIRNMVPGATFADQLQAGRYGRPSPGATTGCDPAFEWDGTDQNGNIMPRGVYLLKLVTPDGVSFRRAVFLGPGV